MEAMRSSRTAIGGGQSAHLDSSTATGTVAYSIVFLRVAVGLFFLLQEAILEKFLAWTSKTLPTIFATWAKNPHGYDFYKSFLTNVALPNAAFFRFLVPYWELVFAICLILGLGLRVLVPLQIFANLNYMMGKTLASPSADLDKITIIVLIAIFLLSAGRYYGLDGYLRRRFPRQLSWL